MRPRVDADCIDGAVADLASPACSWDDGFPAISADGTLIVDAEIPDSGGMGAPGLSILFTNAATSKVVRSVNVLSPGEIPYGEAMSDKMRATVRKRTAAVQKDIDAKGFRALVTLDDIAMPAGSEIPLDPNRPGVYAEYAGEVMRLLDPQTKTEIWRHRFSSPSPWTTKPDPDKECQGWTFARLSTWWDPTSRTVFAKLLYHYGGCMCGSASIPQVFKL